MTDGTRRPVEERAGVAVHAMAGVVVPIPEGPQRASAEPWAPPSRIGVAP